MENKNLDLTETANSNKANISAKFQIRVSEILAIAKRQREINGRELTEIDFLDDSGNIIEVDEKIVDDFRFCGLSNTDFITSEFYLKGWDEGKFETYH